jgi:hypothetical protein
MDYERRTAGTGLRVGAQLLLQDGNAGPTPPRARHTGSTIPIPTGSADMEDSDVAAAAAAAAPSNPKESKKIWHYRAHPSDLREGEKPERGPLSLQVSLPTRSRVGGARTPLVCVCVCVMCSCVAPLPLLPLLCRFHCHTLVRYGVFLPRVQDLRAVGQMRKLTRSSLVWAMGMREWDRLDSLRPVMWYVLNEGTPIFTPSKRGEIASHLLLRLVNLRPSVDIHGAPVRPVPRAKRVLASARCLPHIAQVSRRVVCLSRCVCVPLTYCAFCGVYLHVRACVCVRVRASVCLAAGDIGWLPCAR